MAKGGERRRCKIDSVEILEEFFRRIVLHTVMRRPYALISMNVGLLFEEGDGFPMLANDFTEVGGCVRLTGSPSTISEQRMRSCRSAIASR